MRKEKAKYIRYCLYCGRKFKAKRPKAKFCKDSHRAAYAQNNQTKNPDEARTELFNKIESLLDTYKNIAPEQELIDLGNELKHLLSDILDDFITRKKPGEAVRETNNPEINMKNRPTTPELKKTTKKDIEKINPDEMYYFEPDPPPTPEN